MANKKISALTSATTPLAGTETLPIVQSSTTKQVSVANLTAGRAVSASSFSASGDFVTTGNQFFYSSNGGGVAAGHLYSGSTGKVQAWIGSNAITETDGNDFKNLVGNFVPNVAGKGVNFTANTGAAGKTSQLLNWYEEGTFTPAIEGETTNPTVGYSTQYGAYTRIGRVVNYALRLTLSSISGGSGNVKIVGLPFTAGLSNNPYAAAIELSNVTFSAGYTFVSYRPLSGQTWGRLNQTGSGVASSALVISQLSATTDIIITGAYMV